MPVCFSKNGPTFPKVRTQPHRSLCVRYGVRKAFTTKQHDCSPIVAIERCPGFTARERNAQVRKRDLVIARLETRHAECDGRERI